ncbi:MAG: type I methionyl aminopeptidase [Parcubacteria group bacterium]|nr:type I methionyl aminopeptidase [Parcubacteria group bacterium]
MTITIKTKEEIEVLREGGKRLAKILKVVSRVVAPGVSTKELDDLARKLTTEKGDTPAFLNYQPWGAKRPYPASLCVSINDEVVHGIPNEEPKILKNGDIISLDMGIIHGGLIVDSAVTVGVGKIDKEAKKLLKVTKEALDVGIKAAIGGATVGDIGFAIEKFVEPFGYGHAEGLSGHGVGYKVHEDPFVPNQGKQGEGEILKPGLVIAIEPMLNEGTGKVVLAKDGYTYHTSDGRRSAHFEHTIVITESKANILTK